MVSNHALRRQSKRRKGRGLAMEMQKLREKLRSEQGASILFALFFFIVCAVIGSIVLTAATAAAGRLSRVKEMDERYYAVNSAAQVLEKEINSAVVYVRQESAEK